MSGEKNEWNGWRRNVRKEAKGEDRKLEDEERRKEQGGVEAECVKEEVEAEGEAQEKEAEGENGELEDE